MSCCEWFQHSIKNIYPIFIYKLKKKKDTFQRTCHPFGTVVLELNDKTWIKYHQNKESSGNVYFSEHFIRLKLKKKIVCMSHCVQNAISYKALLTRDHSSS